MYQDTLDANEEVIDVVEGEEGQVRLVEKNEKIKLHYNGQKIDAECDERRARVSAHLLARYGLSPQIYSGNGVQSVPVVIACAGREVLAAWIYVAYTPMSWENEYATVADCLDVSAQSARVYLSRFLEFQ